MKLIYDSTNFALKLSINWCRFLGFFVPDVLTGREKFYVRAYSIFMFFSFVVVFIATQSYYIILIWGDISFMTDVGLVLCANVLLAAKTLVFFFKREGIADIIVKNEDRLRSETNEEGRNFIVEMNRETNAFISVYFPFGLFCVAAWFWSTPKGDLYIRTWYPCDTTQSPAYEIIMTHQFLAVIMTASLEITMDMVIVSMIAICRCRLKLVGLYFETICSDLPSNSKNQLTSDEEIVVKQRIREYAIEHQVVLDCITNLQECFSMAFLFQLLISVIVICITAYQLAVEKSPDMIRQCTMLFLLIGMSTEIFLFSFQGGHLSIDSMSVATSVYNSPWYTFPTSIKRLLLVVMVRAQKPAILTAAGFTTLSLTTYVAIMKASYSFFTVLQQASE